MKNLIKYAFAGAILIGMASCEDDEQNTTDFVQENVERGAVLRTTEIFSNELPINTPGAQFSIEIEEQDVQGGDLLMSVDVVGRFEDNSEDDGDTTGANLETFSLGTVPASEFTDGPFGLPRTTLTYTIEELAALANVDPANLFGGDVFIIDLTLNLTDGRVFNADNAGGIITGGFFNSPFRYNASVTCPVGEDQFLGDYALSIVSGVFPDFGVSQDFTEQVYTISNEEGGPTERTIEDVIYLPEFGGFIGDMVFNLVCEDTVTPQQSVGGGVGCGGAIQQGSFGTNFGSYDQTDDTSFTLDFILTAGDTDSTCPSAPYTSVLLFTKQ
ncbi:hypothetical protein [Dokdonia donghaensis]|uniref:hypothetical protein n=1 Tax=Dokdonia donghaensis TaxID=326320 RepID=UPI00068C2ED6|nr:hypothetical protein [Dokdonia donghaensis]ANH60172.1 hypothetical protein I597_1255 [Dokdonia donghaensis DSW-1]